MRLPSRFDDADVELMRYAGTAGLLRAPPEGRPAVAAKSARAVQATTEWLGSHEFLTDSELRRWDDLVRVSCMALTLYGPCTLDVEVALGQPQACFMLRETSPPPPMFICSLMNHDVRHAAQSELCVRCS